MAVSGTFGDLIREDESETRRKIQEIADNWVGTPHVDGSKGPDTIDCSGFICAVYSEVYGVSGLDASNTNIHNLRSNALFRDTSLPKLGDLILWTGHGGIVWSSTEFIASNSTNGVEIKPFDTGYWSTFDPDHRIFRRYHLLDAARYKNIPV